jgi:DNA-binding transcriptional regulator YdaS (Cro superfamily)
LQKVQIDLLTDYKAVCKLRGMTALEHAIEIVGSQTALAKNLGVAQAHVWHWLHSRVPADRCPAIERATHGAVRCEDLRPDVDWAVLRNSDCPKEAA